MLKNSIFSKFNCLFILIYKEIMKIVIQKRIVNVIQYFLFPVNERWCHIRLMTSLPLDVTSLLQASRHRSVLRHQLQEFVSKPLWKPLDRQPEKLVIILVFIGLRTEFKLKTYFRVFSNHISRSILETVAQIVRLI